MNNPTVDHDAAREIELYAYNTSQLHPQYLAIARNVARRIKNGNYDAEKAPALWQYWIDEAARAYCKEFGGEIRATFPKVTREYVAQRVAVMEWTEIVEEVAHELAAEMHAASEASKRGEKGAAARFKKAKAAAEKAALYPGCFSRHMSELMAA